MRKALIVVALIAVAAVAAAASQAEAGSWTGVVTDTHCGEKGAKADHASCAVRCVKGGSAQWALWDPQAKQLYELVNAKDAETLAGKQATVKGTLNAADKKIDVSSMEAAAGK